MNRQMSLFDKEKSSLSVDNMSNPALLRDIPFDKIYDAARKEASRKKPVFFVHKYFARRITSNFRMMLVGAMLPYEEDIWDYLYDDFSHENREDMVVLDSFMGGGTTIFESLRLNTKVIGCDLQPLSKFATTALVKKMDKDRLKKDAKKLEKRVAGEIMKYHRTKCPCCGEQADVMYTFHVKKVKAKGTCECHKLYSNFVLALKKNEFTLVCPDCGRVFKHDFKSDGPATCECGAIINTPQDGYVNHGTFTCPRCGEKKVISDYGHEDGYPLDTDIIAIEYYCPHCKSHDYKAIDEADKSLYKQACDDFDRLQNSLPIPQQKIPVGYNTNQILNHGYEYFKDLFNKRQLLCLGLLQKAINEVEDPDSRFWFQLAFSGMLEMNTMFCRYQANAYKICNIFFNHAYVPITMPVENNVWGSKLGTGNFTKTLEKVIRGKDFCKEIYDISTVTSNGEAEVVKCYSDETVETEPVDAIDKVDALHPMLHCGDSSNLSFIQDESVNLVLTDPPFGANVMYSELIDFFHVWDNQSNLAKDLGFDIELSPKDEEIIVNSVRGKTQKDYEDGLTRVFSECNRVLKKNGFLIFSFHDNSIDSWVSILNSIDAAGFALARTYPLHAESRTGAHTSNKNSIALDIMLICRKKTFINAEVGSIDKAKKEKIEKKAYSNTEEIIKRLSAVNAEITVPDISNIFISEYFSECYANGANIRKVIDELLPDIEVCVKSLDTYFSEYEISERRSGWWSELYKKKWEV